MNHIVTRYRDRRRLSKGTRARRDEHSYEYIILYHLYTKINNTNRGMGGAGRLFGVLPAKYNPDKK